MNRAIFRSILVGAVVGLAYCLFETVIPATDSTGDAERLPITGYVSQPVPVDQRDTTADAPPPDAQPVVSTVMDVPSRAFSTREENLRVLAASATEENLRRVAAAARRAAESRVVPFYVEWHGQTVKEVEIGERYSRLVSDFVVPVPTDDYFRGFEGDIASERIHLANYNQIWELTCLRDFWYYFVVAEEEGSGFFVFFPDDENTPIAELVGERYSDVVQRHFDAVGYRKAVRTRMGGSSCKRLSSDPPSTTTEIEVPR